MKPHNVLLTFATTVSLLLAGCGGKRVHLTPSTSVPAATAAADINHDKNGNTLVDLKVKHLAKPANLTPPKATYLVWIQASGSAPVKQGELQVNDNLEAEIKTTTTYKAFQIFVTAEDSATVTSPSGQEVLRQQVTG